MRTVSVVRDNHWALALSCIAIITVLGNILVIVAVLRYNFLHSRINYFILGLAIADLLVGVAIMPFAIYVEVLGGLSRGLGDHSLTMGFKSGVNFGRPNFRDPTTLKIDFFSPFSPFSLIFSNTLWVNTFRVLSLDLNCETPNLCLKSQRQRLVVRQFESQSSNDPDP